MVDMIENKNVFEKHSEYFCKKINRMNILNRFFFFFFGGSIRVFIMNFFFF